MEITEAIESIEERFPGFMPDIVPDDFDLQISGALMFLCELVGVGTLSSSGNTNVRVCGLAMYATAWASQQEEYIPPISRAAMMIGVRMTKDLFLYFENGYKRRGLANPLVNIPSNLIRKLERGWL